MYRTTKEQCQNEIDKSMPIVCSYCGGTLEPLETEDNSGNPTFWRGCKKCMVFNGGVRPSVYETARLMVDENNYQYYNESKPDKESSSFDYWRKTNISGTTGVVMKILNIHGVSF